MNVKISCKNLYIALLDDDPKDCFRGEWFNGFAQKFGQPKWENLLCTENAQEFIQFANNYRDCLLFCDPGALGNLGNHYDRITSENDRLLYRWLNDNSGRILNVLWLIHPSHYEDTKVFDLKDQLNLIGGDIQRHEVYMLLCDWLLKNNPLALFHKDRTDPANVDIQLKNLYEPALSAVCKQLELNISKKKEKGKRLSISKYYYELHKKQWEKNHENL